MVRGLSKEKDISFSMAVTGIAGPSGGTKYKPSRFSIFLFYTIKRYFSKKNYLKETEILLEKKLQIMHLKSRLR